MKYSWVTKRCSGGNSAEGAVCSGSSGEAVENKLELHSSLRRTSVTIETNHFFLKMNDRQCKEMVTKILFLSRRETNIMRLLCLFILFTTQTILFAAGGDSLNPKQPDSISSKKREWEIVSNGLKNLKIGDPAKKIYKAFAGLKIKHNKYNAYIIIDKLDTICVVWCDENNVVGSIFTRSKRFFHAGDIRVGLRIDEVMRKRPGIVMAYNGHDDEESLLLYDAKKNNKIDVDLLIQSDDGQKLGVYENEHVDMTSSYRTTGFIYGVIIQKVN